MSFPKSIDLLSATIKDLQSYLADGTITSVQLTEAYLAVIEANNHKGLNLRGIIETSPVAVAIAKDLDEERASTGIRSPLHGIPIIVKDNIATDVELGMETTAGSTALIGMRVPGDAFVIKRLRDAGAIILGKANMSMYSHWFKDMPKLLGWSARGGQTLNPYMDMSYEEGNRPGASSSGSATGVSSGMAAASLGSETSGSLLEPACYQFLYALKPSLGLVSRSGVIPISYGQDTVGVMAKSTYDCAVLLSQMVGQDKEDGITKAAIEHRQDYTKFMMEATFKGKRLGVVREFIEEPNNVILMSAFNAALDRMTTLETTVVDGVQVASTKENEAGVIDRNMKHVLNTDFKVDMEDRLKKLKGDGPRTVQDLINYNDEHFGVEFMPGYPGQSRLVASLATRGKSDPEYLAARAENIELCGPQGMDYVFDKYNLDAIVLPNPADYAAPGGYPGAAVPLVFDGHRPQGLVFYGRKWSEGTLLELMAAYEANFPARVVPASLKSRH